MARISKINVNNTEYDLGNQVSTMPTASASELGKVYQYIGTTDANYTHGYFYECKAGSTSGTYEWVNVPTGSGSSGMATDGSNASSDVTFGGTFTVGTRATGSTFGLCSTTEGILNTGSGHFSHAEGENTTASGNHSHTEGVGTVASEACSHAEGGGSVASGLRSHVEGYYNTAGYTNQHVSGKYNDNKADTLLEVGNGTSTSARSNALEVYSNGDLNITGDYKKSGSIVFGKLGKTTYGVSAIPSGADLNDYKAPSYCGEWFLADSDSVSVSNKPYVSSGCVFRLIVESLGGSGATLTDGLTTVSNATMQTAITTNLGNNNEVKTYKRYYNGSSWTAWTSVEDQIAALNSGLIELFGTIDDFSMRTQIITNNNLDLFSFKYIDVELFNKSTTGIVQHMSISVDVINRLLNDVSWQSTTDKSIELLGSPYSVRLFLRNKYTGHDYTINSHQIEFDNSGDTSHAYKLFCYVRK